MNRYLYPFVLLFAFVGISPAWAMEAPLALVKDTSDRVLAAVTERKAELDAAPEKVYGLINEIVLPHFDFVRMSRLVLGKYWRKASDAQKDAFVSEFRQLLVRTYGVALLNYSGQKIEYLPMREVGDAKEVNVNTEVAEHGAPPIPINYRLYLNGGQWKVFDITIDSVSLVSNYRTGFNNQIRRHGLDGLIAKLKERNQKSGNE